MPCRCWREESDNYVHYSWSPTTPGTAWTPRGTAQPWQPQGIPTTCSQVLTFCCWAPRARDSQVSEGCCRQGAEALGFPLTPASSRVLLGTPRASLCNLSRGSWGAGHRVGGDIPKAVQKGPCSAHPGRRVISRIRHGVLLFPLYPDLLLF